MTRSASSRAAWAVVLLAAGCAGRPPNAAPRSDTLRLRAPHEYGGAFLDRQSIVATYGAQRIAFDAVLQKRADEIVLLGTTPFGSRAFVLKQEGLDVSFESYVPVRLPFPPLYILTDVHRVYLDGIDDPSRVLADGLHRVTRGGEVITERWLDGRLLERRFLSVGGPDGEIVVAYDGGMAPGGPPPSHIAFVNGWYGYRLDITTQSHQPL